MVDLRQPNLDHNPDLSGIEQSVAGLRALLAQQEATGIPRERIVLAGFSQGGVVALETALSMHDKPAGVLALSTWLAQPVSDAHGLCVFMAHGEHDHVVPPALAIASRDMLRTLGAEVEWHNYPMAHAVHPTEIADIGAWLRARLT